MKTIEQQIIEKYKELVELYETTIFISLWEKMNKEGWDKRQILCKDLTALKAQLKEQEEDEDVANMKGAIEAMQEYHKAKLEEVTDESARLIGEIIDNYEADAINLPAELYNELKFHWKQLIKHT